MACAPQIQVRQRFGGIAEFSVTKKIRGSCLCGGVRFEVEPPFIRAGHCHCERCRKHSGTAVCTQARVWIVEVLLHNVEDLIIVYGICAEVELAFGVSGSSSGHG